LSNIHQTGAGFWAKLNTDIPTKIPGSFKQISVRYGTGIANGGDNGNTHRPGSLRSPDGSRKHTKEPTLLLLLNIFSGISQTTGHLIPMPFSPKVKGSASNDKAADYYNREIFNRKTEFNTNQSHLLF
jgi:maltoporin